MSGKRRNPLKQLRRTNLAYPVIIGLGVVFVMFYRNFDSDLLKNISFSFQAFFWFIFAILLMSVRDIGYMIRLKILSDNYFSWRQTFRIIMLWEFTSAITPSAIGGTSVAIIFLNKEGLNLGKASAVVMATSFLDELYFLLTFPLLLLFISHDKLFALSNASSELHAFANKFFWLALAGYSLKLIYTVSLSWGLFINPRGLKWLLLWVFKMPFLRRWRNEANEAGNEIVASSFELRRKPFRFWLKAFASTILSWTSRYWVVNALFLMFTEVPDHLLLYARQLVAWIMMLVVPTPGGSGGAEWIFTQYLGDLIQLDPTFNNSLAILLAFIWRLISYYPYLIIGTLILPKWIRLMFGKNQPG